MEREDLRAALPEPPPAHPARRETAIAAALDRFDARAESNRVPDRRAARDSARWWSAIGRPQIAALATIAVVASVALPVWMSGDPHVAPAPKTVQRAAPPAAVAQKTAPERADALSPAPATQPPQRPEPAADTAPRIAAAPAAPSAPAIPRSESGDRLADTANFAAPPPPPPPPAPPPAAIAAAPVDAPRGAAGEDIVVTSSRVAKSPVAEPMASESRRTAESVVRSEWTACTVNDPRRDPQACRPQDSSDPADPAARAAALVTDGLTQAWRGDLDGAIATFGRAIESSPRLASAYLNRGLAYQRKGDPTRALADFDRAVHYAPAAAQGYYHRGLLRRQQGDRRGAQTDERRAHALDRQR